MKNLLAICLIIISYYSYSQRTFGSRAQNNYIWYYQYFNMGKLEQTYPDSIKLVSQPIHNKTYNYKVFNGYFNESNRKIFYVRSIVDSQEKVIYDFNLALGDTFRVDIDSFQNEFIVISKSKVKIENDSLILIKLKNSKAKNNMLGPDITWLESIGSIENTRPFDWTFHYHTIDYYYSLQCATFKDDNILSSLGKSCFRCNFFADKKKWYTWASNNNGDQKFSKIYQYKKDTIFLGNAYKDMGNQSYVRYDSLKQKYYQFTGGATWESMIFNELAHKGDTISTFFGLPEKVIGSKVIKGDIEYYKMYYTDRNDSLSSDFGSYNRVFWHNSQITFPEYKNGNLCFEKNGLTQYRSPDYYILKTCEPKSSIQNIDDNEVEIYSHLSKLIIKMKEIPRKNTSISIYNMMGNEVLRMKLSNDINQELEISQLPKGIFIVKYENITTKIALN